MFEGDQFLDIQRLGPKRLLLHDDLRIHHSSFDSIYKHHMKEGSRLSAGGKPLHGQSMLSLYTALDDDCSSKDTHMTCVTRPQQPQQQQQQQIQRHCLCHGLTQHIVIIIIMIITSFHSFFSKHRRCDVSDLAPPNRSRLAMCLCTWCKRLSHWRKLASSTSTCCWF